jgi:hypothetical protein
MGSIRPVLFKEAGHVNCGRRFDCALLEDLMRRIECKGQCCYSDRVGNRGQETANSILLYFEKNQQSF